MKFVVACRKFFGLKSGESLGDFVTECKELTDRDRMDLKPELEVALGVSIED